MSLDSTIQHDPVVSDPADSTNGQVLPAQLPRTVPQTPLKDAGSVGLGHAPAVSPAAEMASGPAPVAAGDPGEEVQRGDVDEEEYEYIEIGNDGTRRMLYGASAWMVSMVFHLTVVLILGLCALDSDVRQEVQTLLATVLNDPIEEQPVEIELDQDLDASTEISSEMFDAGPAVAATFGTSSGIGQLPKLAEKILERSDMPQVEVGPLSLLVPDMARALQPMPEGSVGDPRQIVESYEEALDQITQELYWMLDRGDVLALWCFDQSESMLDDREQIRQRISKIYNELGLSKVRGGNDLVTSVTSYGASYQRHTPKPTNDGEEIRQAIASVPIDRTGIENMCQAVAQAIADHRGYAKRRQLALILVTDESGNRQNNLEYLESALAEAKAAHCRVYTLGREAAFGYPFLYISWQHPQTLRTHWLPVDRGPESAFVEQLQTDGFDRRYDALSSGFGPYEQARLAFETNAIFFMLPTVESNLVGGADGKRRYELEALRRYRPDLRPRVAVVADREKYPLRSLIWKVVNDLNPYEVEAVRIQTSFSVDPAQFVQQARLAQERAKAYINYLEAAKQALEGGKRLREQEAEPRWQGNYDLIYAQVVAYQARMYEYGVALEQFIAAPKQAPTPTPPTMHTAWTISTRKETRTTESRKYIALSTKRFYDIIEDHAGTPWAERAKWELERGFGIDVVPYYEPPYPEVGNPIPVPNL